ncbi:Septum formation protein Maf [hydrothermal vent metagenome]|uniref:Septum formation protein Maf n=1 Tax=hydrothermal vent metagenome TaxID=652676 RepID=A0A3B0XH41_9ZZZZ
METFREPQITLASASPRRRELLRQIQVFYEVLPVDIDESHQPGETAEQYVNRLAVQKARAGFDRAPWRPALGSDTIVVAGQQILGKPQNRQMAEDMLMLLSGNTHQVMTAVAIVSAENEYCALNISEVEFTALNSEQIALYCQTDEPLDKAGAYGIQGLAAQFIKNINGSYSGIMGLPLFETAELLKRAGVVLASPARR